MPVKAPTTFYTIANDAYFPGLVALVNSLRLKGHDEPIVVGDVGLADWQVESLRPHCRIFALSKARTNKPEFCKPFAHFLNAQGVVVIIDSDMIVTKSLAPLLERAAEGKICVFPDPDIGRWFKEWSEIFDLKAPLRRETYLNSGFITFSTDHHPQLLAEWLRAFERIYTHAPDFPDGKEKTKTNDQDALNAVLMSSFENDDLYLVPIEEEAFRWDFPEVKLTDAQTLACSFKGAHPMILHCCFAPKLWIRNGVERNAYSLLLRRLLSAPDVAVQVPAEKLPPFSDQAYPATSCIWDCLSETRRPPTAPAIGIGSLGEESAAPSPAS